MRLPGPSPTHGLDECHHVLKRDVARHIVRRPDDEAAISTDLVHQATGLISYLLRRAERQHALHAHATIKTQPVTKAALDLVWIHYVRLEGIEDIQPQLDQLREELLHLPATVDHYRFARPLYGAV